MLSSFPEDAEVIVNSIIQNYLLIAQQIENEDQYETLEILENEKKTLQTELLKQREKIHQILSG